MLPNALALTTVLIILALLVIELLLPYRREWAFRSDPDIWRDIAHTAVYSQAITLSRLLFLFVLAGTIEKATCLLLEGFGFKER